GLYATEEHEYLVAIFVPNSNTRLLEPNNDVNDLEGYLRKSEMADHSSWTDIILNNKPLDIMEKIRSQVRRKIKTSIENKEEVKERQAINNLARNVGKMLLPPTGFGRRASSRNRGGGMKSTPNVGVRGNSFSISSQKFMDSGKIEINFQLKLAQNVSHFTIELFITSESGRISAVDWESIDSVGTPFPAEIWRITLLDKVDLFGRPTEQKSENQVSYAVRIKKKEEPVVCSGILVFACKDPLVQVEVSMKPEGSVD
ncbi:hypothetical protein, partial [Paenibacillus sp. P22]|uniref:hypothetical protein n=1 Tax=Paenibacillus sp. P22 TaxID=483908 RepID=UPI000433DF5B